MNEVNLKQVQENLDKIQKLEKETGSPVMRVVAGTTIKAKFARLPVVALTLDFMVEQLEPVAYIPKVIRIPYFDRENKSKTDTDRLKEHLLKEWKDNFKDTPPVKGAEWMWEVDSVELTECDLLVPKES